MPKQLKPTYHIQVGKPLTGRELLLAGQENYAGQYHQLAIHEYGNPKGIPVIFVHGGPGAGTSPADVEYFDLSKYRVILFDQRGSGQSTPRNCLEDNNTDSLTADIEVIRSTLGLEKVVIFGGSWGSTLSLLYAIRYPEHVSALVLRGVFLGEKKGIEAFFREDSAAVTSNPGEWRAFLDIACPGEKLQTYDAAPLEEKFGILAESLFAEIKAGKWKEVGAAYATWEIINAVPASQPELRQEYISGMGDDDITMGLMEIYYIIHKLWLPEGFIIENAAKLAGIPTKVVQGHNDNICPAEQAAKLCAALTVVNRGLPRQVDIRFTNGGHFASTEDNKHALIESMVELADELRSAELSQIVGASREPLRHSHLLPPDSLFQQIPVTLGSLFQPMPYGDNAPSSSSQPR